MTEQRYSTVLDRLLLVVICAALTAAMCGFFLSELPLLLGGMAGLALCFIVGWPRVRRHLT